MLPFYMAFFMLHVLLGFGSPVNPPADPDDGDPDEPLPQTMATICTGKQVDNEARIKTMARMMDWSVHRPSRAPRRHHTRGQKEHGWLTSRTGATAAIRSTPTDSIMLASRSTRMGSILGSGTHLALGFAGTCLPSYISHGFDSNHQNH